MKESARYILPILVFVALILSIGTVGYLIIEDGVTVSDAFYMTATAITPAQFDEVHKLSVGGRYFTVALVFCGFGAVVAFATQFARLIVQSELEGVGVITRKQMRRRIRQMKSHYIVCGYGEIGGAICGELQDQQLPFVVVADDEPSLAAIERDGYAVVRGNPTADTSLKEAGIERAVGVIAVLADDSDNLFISLAARELNPKILIIARGEHSSIEDRILRAGADIVVSPMKLGGRQIAALIKEQAGQMSISDELESRSSVLGLRLTVFRDSESDSLTVADVIQKSGAVGVAGIERADGSFDPNPPDSSAVRQDDAVVLITRTTGKSDLVQKAPTGRLILLADDHRALRLLFARKLASAGHDVIQAASGDEALLMARANMPALIVLDVNMPSPNGYEVCATLRQSQQFAEVPIILYSGDETEEFVQRGQASGADMCIRKTSKSSELLARIEEAFSEPRRSTSIQTDAGNAETAAPRPEGDRVSRDPPFDMEAAMENVGGDRDLMDELLDAMLEDTPRLMERIRIALSSRDSEELRIAAHTLKGSVAMLHARDVSTLAAKMESVASDRYLAEADKLHAELKAEVDALMTAIERHTGEPRAQ